MYSDMDISNVPTEIAFILSYNIALLLPVLCSIFTEATILGQNDGDKPAVKVRSSLLDEKEVDLWRLSSPT